jgi:acetolactate synthase-1/2/3 large subunit
MNTGGSSDNVKPGDSCKQAPETKASSTGAQAVASVIADMPNPTVFGMPGGYTVQIFDALYPLSEQVSVNLVREESLATVMAESFGRLTGTPAVVIGQGAWVLGNAGIGIMEALLGCSPMVLLIDSTDGGTFSHLGPYQAGGGGYGAYDLASAMRAITKQTFVATNPSQAMQMTRLAFKHATTGEMGPVAVIFNGPALYKRLDPKREPPIFASDRYRQVMQPSASQASIDYAATLIRAAKRPIIIAGNGVRLSKAQNALKNFAENHDIEVVTTPGGKGTFSEANPLALGIIGAFGHETANAATGRADLIIALGTKLGASDTANQHTALIDPSRQKFIQIDIEPLNLSWTTPIDAPIFGEVGEALGRLDAALGEQRFNGKASVAALRQDHPYFDHAALKQRADFSGRDAAATLSEVLPAETIVTCDAGENRLFILREYQTKVGGDVLQPNGGGGMGYAVPAAMAAAYLYKDRPVVAVCGDGGISMSLHGLMTAIELGLKMTVVVLDNQVLGWVYSSQRDRIIASSFASFDLVAMTRAMGCFAELAQTSDELRSLLGKALKHPGVSIVVAKISKTDRYQDIMSSLHKYDVYSVPENH